MPDEYDGDVDDNSEGGEDDGDDGDVDDNSEGGGDDGEEVVGREGQHGSWIMILMLLMLVLMLLLMLMMMMMLMLLMLMILMMVKCLPGWGSERVVGTMVSRPIVIKSLKE